MVIPFFSIDKNIRFLKMHGIKIGIKAFSLIIERSRENNPRLIT
jgi:hypothetical protein